MKIIIANWKNHPGTLDEARALFLAEVKAAEWYQGVKTIICPPLKFLPELSVSSLIPNLYSPTSILGAQDVFWPRQISPAANLGGGVPAGVKYALVGHSDRRAAGDTDEIVNQKLRIALESGITPVLLVGERVKGEGVSGVLQKQLETALTGFTIAQVVSVMIVYEPVWAISTNPAGAGPDTPENTLEAIRIINNFLAITYDLSPKPCLYGGSVNPANIADFLRHPTIAGAVIGRASLDPDQFGEILKTVSEL